MFKLYGHELSGNTYKVRLFLSLLHLDSEFIQLDMMNGEHKQPEFLKINPFGQVPVLIDGETVFQDAQAILVYLARKYGGEDWFPTDAEAMSRVVRWLSTTAGEIRQGPENARLYYVFGTHSINIERATQKSHFILQLLNDHLSQRTWLEFERPTVADIAAFPYVALAPDGHIELSQYSHVLRWIEQIKNLPGFVGMPGIEAPVTA
ncbi:glutathione S-transferase family protein [Capilliphycus salinus ALCB114379]|uniref:glutathione S-transferase family protein n=1 Tax=Capilliphycus salinus TaxID=2768948 RepID=UPI0039A4F22A